MKNIFKIGVKSIVIIISISILNSCKRDDNENKYLHKTSLRIVDSIRHYYPILRGTKLNLVVKIENTGKYPLKIYNVLPSCGCTVATFPKRVILPEKYGLIHMKYESNKNIGYVGIYTTIVANTEKSSHTMFFDLNVVSNPLYTKDFEEIYNENKKDSKFSIKTMVEGDSHHDYVTDTISKLVD